MTAIGPMLALRNEIGLDMEHRFDTSFLRIADMKAVREEYLEDAVIDNSVFYYLNAPFIHLNMTDYEERFIGPGESKELDKAPLDDVYKNYVAGNNAHDFYNQKERNPFKIDKERFDEIEPRFNFFRSNSEEENAGGDEDDDDEEGEGDEDEVDSYTTAHYHEDDEYDEEEFVNVDWEPGMGTKEKTVFDSQYFGVDDTLRDRYDNLELESFMKFLDVKPFLSWRDVGGYHDRLGLHSVEDFSQRVDPEYHMLGEIEREDFEKKIFNTHRTGSTVRFVIPGSKPHFGRSSD